MPSARILAVDDDVGLLQLMREMLERQGYDVLTAENGQQALDAATDELPDLMLLDVKMPNQTGSQLYREMLSIDTISDIPVVFISGVPEFEIFASDCQPLPPPRAWLDKPIDLSVLKETIDDILQ